MTVAQIGLFRKTFEHTAVERMDHEKLFYRFSIRSLMTRAHTRKLVKEHLSFFLD